MECSDNLLCGVQDCTNSLAPCPTKEDSFRPKSSTRKPQVAGNGPKVVWLSLTGISTSRSQVESPKVDRALTHQAAAIFKKATASPSHFNIRGRRAKNLPAMEPQYSQASSLAITNRTNPPPNPHALAARRRLEARLQSFRCFRVLCFVLTSPQAMSFCLSRYKRRNHGL